MAPPSDNDEEHGVGDKPERDGRLVTVEAGRGHAYGAVRRGEGYGPDADAAYREAGCNGPRGAIVYMRRKPPRPAP